MARWTSLIAAPCLLVGCPSTPSLQPPDPCVALGGAPGLVDGTLINPFPSWHVTASTDDGCRVRIPDGALPVGTDSDPLPVRRFDVRDGFSAGQTSYWRPGVAVDGATLPRWDSESGGLGSNDSVQMWDLDAGVRLPAFAEVDAYPEQADAQRAVLVRPLAPLPFGARVAVVVTDRARTLSGAPLPRAPAFAAVVEADPLSSEEVVALHYRALFDRLAALGVPTAEIVQAWDFPVGTQASINLPLQHVLAGMRDELPAEASFEPPVVIDAFLDRDAGDTPSVGLWRELRGSVQLTHYLWTDVDSATDEEHDAGAFRVGVDGRPIARGLDEAFFIAVVPDSVRDADPGTVPVVVFGHGIFSAPQDYLTSPNDVNSTIELLNRLGAIGIGGEWRGLTERDRPDAIRVAVNLGKFPLLTDKLVQGVSNQVALPRLLHTRFVEQPAFLDGSGESLIDAERVYYFGISLGGIEGLTLLANSELIEHGVLHVPGSTWSTMLERSTNWNAFEPFVIDHVDAPWDRQLLYTTSQLLWDAVDPISHYLALADKSLLMQVSVGDEQVPNFTAESIARGAQIPLVTPAAHPVAGLETLTTPTARDSRGYMQFDSQLGLPPSGNRPAATASEAHTFIRGTDEAMSQIEAFFAAGSEGTIEHPCAPGPCVFDGR